jgi:predicted PurR-regulated permease PerM
VDTVQRDQNSGFSAYAIPVAIATVIFVGIVLHFITDAFLTFVAALFIANIFMPLVSQLRKWKLPMVVSILVVLALVGVLLFGVAVFVVATVSSVTDVLPKYQQRWDHVLLPGIMNLVGSISSDLAKQATEFTFSSVLHPSRIIDALSSITGLLSSFMLILLFTLFILASQGQFGAKIERAFPPSRALFFKTIVGNIEKRVRRYLLTTLLINTLAAITMSVVLLIFGVDLAIVWGVLTFLLMFIPNFGSLFAIALPILVAFLQFDSVITPVMIGVVVILTQLIIGSYISPKLMGSSLNLSPLLILISIIFWGWVWGPLGMILAVPITSAIAIIFENIPSLHPLAVLMSAGGQKSN